jgi:preprotein translocase subunit Sss1
VKKEILTLSLEIAKFIGLVGFLIAVVLIICR